MRQMTKRLWLAGIFGGGLALALTLGNSAPAVAADERYREWNEGKNEEVELDTEIAIENERENPSYPRPPMQTIP